MVVNGSPSFRKIGDATDYVQMGHIYDLSDNKMCW